MRARSASLHLLLALIAIALFFTACGRKRARIAKPPRIGKTQSGIASWYGPPYHGRRSANGEVYDMEKLTAAHRTFAFDTWVRVRNLDNGKEIDVRITDRGPFVRGRVIDLSKAAARNIDMIGPGIAKVKLKVIDPRDAIVPESYSRAALSEPKPSPGESKSSAGEPKPPANESQRSLPGTPHPPLAAPFPAPIAGPPPPPLVGPLEPQPPPPPITAELFGVQIGAFRDRARAEELRSTLQARFGKANLILRDTQIPTWRVVVGEFPDEASAESAATQLRLDFPEAFVVRQDAPLVR